MNALDEATADLPPVPDGQALPAGGEATPAPAPSLFDQALQVLQGRQQAEEVALRRTALQNHQAPDQAVEANQLGQRFNVPAPVVARDLEGYRKRAQADDLLEAARTNPRLGAWLQDPANAAVAQPDLKPLSAIERSVSLGRNIAGAAAAGLMDFSQGMWGALEAASELRLPQSSETTALSAPDEAAFRAWAQANHINDVDAPDAFYDYRGFWQDQEARDRWQVGDHFPDTYKQHGHPTFSVESRYSRDGMDGGRWQDETFVPPAPQTTWSNRVANFAHMAALTAKHLAEDLRGDQAGAGFIERAAYSGVESIGMMVPGLVAGAITGGSGALLALAGVATGGQTYTDARAQDLAPGKALAAGTIQGTIEVATEFLPAHLLLGDLAAKAGFLKILAHQVASEVPGEEIATALQDLNEWAFLPENTEKSFRDYLDARPSAAAATAISVLTATGGTAIATHGTLKVLEQLAGAVEASETAKKDPAVIQRLLEHSDAVAGETVFYAPVDTFTTYFQTQGVDPAVVAAGLTGDPGALAKATEAGGQLAIPASRYAALFAGSEHHGFFADELRLAPDLPNAREQGAAAAASTDAEAPAGDDTPSPREALRQTIASELERGGRYRPRDAQTNAAVVDAFFGRLAEIDERDPRALYAQYGIEVRREGLEAPTAPAAVVQAAEDAAAAALVDPSAPEPTQDAPPLTPPAEPEQPAAETTRPPDETPATTDDTGTAPVDTPVAAAPVDTPPEPRQAPADEAIAAPPEGQPRPRDPAQVRQETHDEALQRLTAGQPAYGPGGLKVRVVPKANGNAELEVSEKGRRRFEGEFPADQGPAIGAARLAELAVTPTPALVTPQIGPARRPLNPAAQEMVDGAATPARGRFMATYLPLLEAQHRKGGYGWPIEEAPLVAAKMATGLARGSAHLNTPTLKAAAKALGLTNTAEGWRGFFTPAAAEHIPASISPEGVAAAAPPAQTGATDGAQGEPLRGATETGDADSPGGRPAPAREPDRPAGRPGDQRAQDVARGEPGSETPVPAQPPARPRDRKRRPAPSESDVRGRVATPGAGPDAGPGGGDHAPAHVDTADLVERADVAAADARGEAPRAFTIDDTGALTAGGWPAKLADNLAALRLLKVLQKDGRFATDAEQAVLTRYIGWGHTNLAPVVGLLPEHLENRDPRVLEARAELEQLLTRDELKALGESTANAHYSFHDLPHAMWAAVQRLGFTGGLVLEPAIGTGHFFGTMPPELRAAKRTKLWGVEKEPIAAAIAQQLYQQAHIQASPLEQANLPANYFDLVISNVPFGQIEVFDPDFTSPIKRALSNSVHNYYFGKALDVVRPGGLVAFVTSRYTMDSRSDTVRAYLDERADLLGAVRLPDQAFAATAGTNVVTDVLFFRKRAEGEARTGARFVTSQPHEALTSSRHAPWTNEYFQAHPDHVLGTEDLSGKMARSYEPQYNVSGTLAPAALQRAVERILPADVYTASTAAPRTLARVISRDVKQGTFQIDKGKLYTYDKGTLTASTLTGKALARATAFVPLRDAYQGVLDVMLKDGSDAALTTAQRALLTHYKAFVAAHGLVNDPRNRSTLEDDPNAGRILALEHVEEIRRKGKPLELKLTGYADIFSTRVFRPVAEATTADSPISALTQSLAWKGAVDLPYMAQLTGQDEASVRTALAGQIYQDPATQVWTPRAEYLSGDVVTKLAQAQAAAAVDAATYAPHVAALEAVQPTPFGPEDIVAPFGATWVPLDVYRQFIEAEARTTARVSLTNSENRVQFYVDAVGRHEFLPPEAYLGDWIAHALNGNLPTVTKTEAGTTFTDVPATEAYRESLGQLRERWAEWWSSDDQAATTITGVYNAMFNRDVPYVADGAHLVLPNANPEITFRDWQKNVIWRTLQTGNTLIAHAVGAGKTFAMTAIAGEWKRLGLANKPLIVVPNHLTEQWRREFLRIYPTARLLVPTKEDFTPGNRQRLIARIANNDWDAVVMAQSHFLRVSVKLETLQAFIQQQEDQLLVDGSQQMGLSAQDFKELVTQYGAGDKKAAQAFSGRSGTPRSVKDIARAILNLRARLQKRLNQAKKDAPVTFEELGVDGLLVDEAHLYKNLYFSTGKNNIAGLKGSDADRAMDMFLKVRQINAQSGGRNTVFATGTPVSNTISELYTMFRYLAQPTLERLGMGGFDAWANANAEARAEMEPAPGGGYKERVRLRKWTNLRELSAQFRRFADVVTTADLKKSGALTLPELLHGQPTLIGLDAHPDMTAFMGELSDRIDALKTGKVDPRDDNHLKITTEAGLAAIDMRLVNPAAAEDPHGRIPTAAHEIATRYRASTATKGAQIVFLDVGIPDAKAMPPLPEALRTGEPSAPVPEAPEADDDIVDLEAEAAAAGPIVAFNYDLYGDLRRKLVAQGIPDDQIAYVHQAKTPYELGLLYQAVKDGRVRVLLASTSKGATGMNVQDKLVALHHLDVPWRPADMEQREGRILRQGNENAAVDIVRYVTKKSFDEYRWGLLSTKQASIVALMKGTLTSLDDVDPAQLDMQTAQALASGDPRTLDMLNLEREVKALETRYLAFTRRQKAAARSTQQATAAIDRLTRRGTALAGTVTAAEAFEAKPRLQVRTEPDSYDNTTTATIDTGTTEGRKALQQRLEELAGEQPYQEALDVATGGPFTVTLNRTTQEILQGGQRTERAGYYYSVTAAVGGEQLTMGSTPTWWDGEKKYPAWVRSLDSYLAAAKLRALQTATTELMAGYRADSARDVEIAGKAFGQTDQLTAKKAALGELRGALGQGTPESAADDVDAAPPADRARSFDQPLPPDEPPDAPPRRGNIEFGTDPQTGAAKTVINLMARADLSTFLHESGHLFLEVLGDVAERQQAKDPSTLTRDQQQLVDDWAQVLQQLGVGSRAELGTAQHEQWATWFEDYLREGHAPSLELLEPFARFRAWLLAIYRSVVGRVPVTKEIRGVFDRMLAGEDAIAEAEKAMPPLFTTADESGMPAWRFELYRKQVEDAHRKRREEIDRVIAREVRREQSEQYQAERAELEDDVRAEVRRQKPYLARETIREGLPNAEGDTETVRTPWRLDRQQLVDELGEARVAQLPDDLVATEGGQPPAFVAEITGYDSPDALVTALLTAPPLEDVVREETDRRMKAAHGDILTDGRIHERAREATASTDHDALVRAEIQALVETHERTQRAYERRWFEAETKLRVAIAEGEQQSVIDTLTEELAATKRQFRDQNRQATREREYERRWFEAETKLQLAIAEGHKQVEIDALRADVQRLQAQARGGAARIREGMPKAEDLARQAAERIAGTPIRRLNPTLYWTAARKAGALAIDLAARQDLKGAIAAKTQQLTNLAFYREAAKMKQLVETSRRWIDDHDRPKARARLGKAGQSYLDQWDGLLDRFEFKKVSPTVLDRRESLAKFLEDQELNGVEASMPPIVMQEARRKNYQQMTVEEFMGVTDGLKVLTHLAALKNKLLRAAAERSLTDVTDTIAGSIYTHNPTHDLPLEFTPADTKWRTIGDWFASHAKMARLARQLDGHTDAGPMWEHVIRPMNDASNAQVEQKSQAAKTFTDLLTAWEPGARRRALSTKTFIPGINASLSKEATLAIALNWGNQTSRDRLLNDQNRHWSPSDVDGILDTLTEKDWQLVQGTWDFIDTFWSAIKAKQERVTGLPPDKVEAIPVSTKFGEFRGGYYPLRYDGRLSLRAGQHEVASDLKLATLSNYVAATTRRGHVKTRLDNVTLSVRLDLGVVFDHIEQVIHDLTHHEMLIDVSRILREGPVQRAIQVTAGDLVYQQFTRGMQDIAMDTTPARSIIDKAANWARGGTQIAALGLNFWTALQQPLGVFNGMERVGPTWVARGMKRWLRDAASMENTTRWISDVSPMMRHRFESSTQDVAELHSDLRRPGGWFDDLVRTVSRHTVTRQTLTEAFLWHIELAQRVADVPTWLGAYEKAMAGGHPEDTAIALADQAVLDSQGGGQMKDLAQVQRGSPIARLFMTFYSYGNTVMNRTADRVSETNFKSPTQVATLLGHLGLLYAAPALLTAALANAVGKGDDKDLEDYLKSVGGEMLGTAMNGWVGLRELTPLVKGGGNRGYEGPAGARVIQLVYDAAHQAGQGKADEGLARALNQVGGVIFRYPATQVQRTIDGFVALEEGRTKNPLALVMGAPPKRKKASGE